MSCVLWFSLVSFWTKPPAADHFHAVTFPFQGGRGREASFAKSLSLWIWIFAEWEERAKSCNMRNDIVTISEDFSVFSLIFFFFFFNTLCRIWHVWEQLEENELMSKVLSYGIYIYISACLRSYVENNTRSKPEALISLLGRHLDRSLLTTHQKDWIISKFSSYVYYDTFFPPFVCRFN